MPSTRGLCAGGPSIQGGAEAALQAAMKRQTFLLGALALFGACRVLAQGDVEEANYSHCKNQEFDYGEHAKQLLVHCLYYGSLLCGCNRQARECQCVGLC